MKRYKLTLLLFILAQAVFGQLPTSPVFESVSIDPLTGLVTIKWQLSPSKGIWGYIMYENLDQGNFVIDTIKSATATQFSFSYPKVLKQTVGFVIAALDSSSNRSLRTEPVHRTIFTKLAYDSCHAQINLTWDKYEGWGANLLHYRVYQYQSGTSTDLSGALVSNDSSYLIQNIKGGQNYCYYVVAERNDGVLSTSNMPCRQTFQDGLPSFIDADQAVFLTNNLVELTFTLDPNAPSKNYQLSASDSYDGSFAPIKQFNGLQGDQLIVVDTLKKTLPKYYRLEALNSCKVGVMASNKVTAMVPISSVGTNQVNLVWNAYQNWPQDIREYDIYRDIGDNGFQLLQTQTGTITDYTDNISGLIGKQLSGNICYYIEAVSNLSSSGKTYTSRSSTVCVDISANVFIPDAFTPNGDGKNDEFKPSFAFLPKSYKLMVFNRNGFKIFESSDPMQGWGGKLPSGEKAPEGVYIYFITFTSGAGKIVEKKGDFSLIYP